jgi:hypothetical protein
MGRSCSRNQFSQSGSALMSALIPFPPFQHSKRSYFHSPRRLFLNIYRAIQAVLSETRLQFVFCRTWHVVNTAHKLKIGDNADLNKKKIVD